HGTVHSPSKTVNLQHIHCVELKGARSPPILSNDFTPTPLGGCRSHSKVHLFVVSLRRPQTSVFPGNRCRRPLHARPLWPACRPALWSRSHCWSWLLCGRTRPDTPD